MKPFFCAALFIVFYSNAFAVTGEKNNLQKADHSLVIRFVAGDFAKYSNSIQSKMAELMKKNLVLKYNLQEIEGYDHLCLILSSRREIQRLKTFFQSIVKKNKRVQLQSRFYEPC